MKLLFFTFLRWDAGNPPLVDVCTSLGCGYGRYPQWVPFEYVGVLHLGVPVLWHTHIRDLSPTAESCKGGRNAKVTSCLG